MTLNRPAFFYGAATRLVDDGKQLAVTIEYVRGPKHLKRIKSGESLPAVLDLHIGPKDAAQLVKRLLKRADQAKP